MLKEIASVSQVYLVTGYTDLRLGIDGLAAIVQGKLELAHTAEHCFCSAEDGKTASNRYYGKETDSFCCTNDLTTAVSDGRETSLKQNF